MKRSQEFDEARRGRIACIDGQVLHDQVRQTFRQIVNPQMKNGSFKGDTPLDGVRNLNRVRKLPQGAGGADTVMIGERNEAHQFQVDFNLIALHLKRQLGGQRRRPVSLGKINGPGRFLDLFLQSPAQETPFFSEFRDEEKALFGLIGVTVKGDSRSVLAGNVWLLPNA